MHHPHLALLVVLVALFPALPTLAEEQLIGESGMILDSSSLSVLGIDLAALEEQVCASRGTMRGAVLVIIHDGGGGALATIQVTVLRTSPGPKEMVFATVQPLSLSMIGPEPIQFWCGAYTYRLQLNAAVTQPVSVLTLTPLVRPSMVGTVSGTLALAALLVLEPVGGGMPWTQPRELSLNIQGTYTVSTGSTFAAGESPLIFFSDAEAGLSKPAPECLTAGEPYTTFCLVAPPERIGLPLD